MIVESDARYDMETAGMPEDMRPPKKYHDRDLPRQHQLAEGRSSGRTARQFEVTKTESAEWPALDDGEYYLVISKGGNPSFMLEGNVRIEVDHEIRAEIASIRVRPVKGMKRTKEKVPPQS